MFSIQLDTTPIYQTLFLTSCPEKCSSVVLSTLGSSDHSSICVRPKTSSDILFHKTIFWYSKADLNRFRYLIAETHHSSKIEHPELIHLFLSGFFLAWRNLSITKSNSRLNLLLPYIHINTIPISIIMKCRKKTLPRSELPEIIARKSLKILISAIWVSSS